MKEREKREREKSEVICKIVHICTLEVLIGKKVHVHNYMYLYMCIYMYLFFCVRFIMSVIGYPDHV